MFRPVTKTVSAAALALAAALAPVSINAKALESADVGDLFRLNNACSQATACVSAQNYICSTTHGDHVGYNCSSGCGTKEGYAVVESY